MKLFIPVAVAACVCVSAAMAEQPASSPKAPSMTVSECLNVLAGLNALDYSGEQLGTNKGAIPAGAKQYTLGAARMTIALDIAALRRVADAMQVVSDHLQRENAKSQENYIAEWHKALEQPCDVQLRRIKQSDLKIGDGPNDNQIPPGVLSAIVPIIDQ